MSKIGNQPIILPPTVTVTVKQQEILVKGQQGELTIILPAQFTVEQTENQLVIVAKSDEKRIRAKHGLLRQLINNAVIGVSKPWTKQLEIVGTGYNVKLQGEDLILKLGYSHPVIFKKKEGVSFQTIGNNKIIVSGPDKQLVGEVAAQIRSIKKPDAYKGKGIKYAGEQLKLKPTKKVKATGEGGPA